VKLVVFYSGGIGSWAAAKVAKKLYPEAEMTLLFTDTKTEHPDTYRFLRESAVNVGAPLVEISDGRNIWEVFRDKRFLGNTRVDVCSRVLKRDLARRWVQANCDFAGTIIVIGIDWSEVHRFERMRSRWAPWVIEAPLTRPPYRLKSELHAWAESEGLRQQELYRRGAAHANCGGGCVKMGQGGFARLLAADPDEYARWEQNEQALRAELGDVAILRDRIGGETRPFTLRQLRERIEAGREPDMFDIGGCGCMLE
jgi:Phosphoadenosine phosphosulfate reductase family